MPLNGFLTPVLADTEKTITGLGTGAIGNPVAPADKDTLWSGSYVYYGKYDTDGDDIAEPVKYRVLDKATTKFGGNTLFLDCDSMLYKAKFNENTPPQGHNSNEWAYSSIKIGLSGNAFLEKDGCFTELEKKAIAESTVEAHDLVEGTGAGNVSSRTKINFGKYVALNNEQVFLLDAEDASNSEYGYFTDENGSDDYHNRLKTGSVLDWTGSALEEWWLRSANNNNYLHVGNVSGCGNLVTNNVSKEFGVSPAFNVNLSSVIFTSLISNTGNAGSPGAEYKLTLKDDNMNIAVTDGKAVTRKDDTVTVPYTITTGTNAGNATQVSVLITDKPYEAGKAVTTGFDYQKLNVGTWSPSGTGTFDIPNTYRDKISGKDYHIYILAEDVNGEKETDYASEPVEIKEIHTHNLKHYDRKEPSDTSEGNIEYWECLGCGELFSDEAGTHMISREDTVIPKLKKISATVTGFSGTYDGKAHGITVKVTEPSSGAAVRYGTVAGTCDKNTSPEYTEIGTYTVYYEVTAEGYKTLTGQAVVEIKEADAPGPEHTHTLTHHERREATETGDGNIEYWECSGCGKLFKDEACTKEITLAETIIPKKQKKDDPEKEEKPVIPIPADNIVVEIPDDSPIDLDSVKGESFANDVGKSLAEAAGTLGKKEEGEESADLYVQFNENLSIEQINSYLNNPEKLTISVNSVSSDSLDSDDSREDAAKVAGLKLTDPKAMTSSVVIKIDIYADNGVYIGTVKKLDQGIDLNVDVSGFTEEVISMAKSFLIMSRHTPEDNWFIAGVGVLDPETKTVSKTVRAFSEFAVAADSRYVIGIEAENGLTADKRASDSEIEKLVRDSAKAYRVLKNGSIEYDVPGEVYSVDAKMQSGRTDSQASVAISLTVNEGYEDSYLKDPENQGTAVVELTSSEQEKPAVIVTVSDNKPMDIRTEPLLEYQVTYAHEIPFFGKGKITPEYFGGITVSQGNAVYKVTKIKVNKKKHLIQITGLEGADKDTVKAVKKATKGSNGLSFKVNPYYVKDTDTVNPKTKKDGSIKSVKVKINGKDYKAKKSEFSFDGTKNRIVFDSENLKGSWTVK